MEEDNINDESKSKDLDSNSELSNELEKDSKNDSDDSKKDEKVEEEKKDLKSQLDDTDLNETNSKLSLIDRVKKIKLSKKTIIIINIIVFIILGFIIAGAYYYNSQKIEAEKIALEEMEALDSETKVRSRVKVDLSIINYERLNSELLFLLETNSDFNNNSNSSLDSKNRVKNSNNNLNFDTKIKDKSIFVELIEVNDLDSKDLDILKDEEIIICKKDNLYKIYIGPFDNNDLAKDYINFIQINDASIIKMPNSEFNDCRYR